MKNWIAITILVMFVVVLITIGVFYDVKNLNSKKITTPSDSNISIPVYRNVPVYIEVPAEIVIDPCSGKEGMYIIDIRFGNLYCPKAGETTCPKAGIIVYCSSGSNFYCASPGNIIDCPN